MITIDAHQHYWQLQNFAYEWHKQVNRPEMNRDYLPADILPQMQAAGIQYSVLIQADNSLAETTWMLDLARHAPHIAGVVGWVDLAAPDVEAMLDHLAREPLFKGIRLITGEWQPLRHGLRALAERNLTCDVLPREGMLPKVTEMMRAHPETRFVVNHLAGQALIPGGVAPWTEQLRPLAELPNVVMKFSAIQGLAEPPPISVETLQLYLHSALTLFGAQRLLFASDWPVSTLSGPYAECIAVMRAATAALQRRGADVDLGPDCYQDLWADLFFPFPCSKRSERAGDPSAKRGPVSICCFWHLTDFLPCGLPFRFSACQQEWEGRTPFQHQRQEQRDD